MVTCASELQSGEPRLCLAIGHRTRAITIAMTAGPGNCGRHCIEAFSSSLGLLVACPTGRNGTSRRSATAERRKLRLSTRRDVSLPWADAKTLCSFRPLCLFACTFRLILTSRRYRTVPAGAFSASCWNPSAQAPLHRCGHRVEPA